jgi:maltose alpha-D-glucosyltransferase/alpha-amylase
LAKVRQRSRVGLLCDAFVDAGFAYALINAMRERREVVVDGCTLRFSATRSLDDMATTLPAELPVRRSKAEGSNSAVILGEQLFLKGYRQPSVGVNTELEMGRFLVEVSPFANVIPVYGALELETADGNVRTLALLQGYVKNQGDAWANTVEYLQRYLAQCQVAPADPDEAHAVELVLLRVLGKRTGELHCALSRTTGDAAFDPEPIRARELEGWGAQLRRDVVQGLARLARRVDDLPERVQEDARDLAAGQARLVERIGELMPAAGGLIKTRHHGDYHLGQVLVTENDVVIIDFEGEPARTPDERRCKASPLRDVAGMLRSLGYAAQVALRDITAETPDEIATLEPFAQTWELLARQAFLDGYQEAVAGSPAHPADPAVAAALTDLYGLEKALYELRYELDNRPDWVGIPIKGLLAFLAE